MQPTEYLLVFSYTYYLYGSNEYQLALKHAQGNSAALVAYFAEQKEYVILQIF